MFALPAILYESESWMLNEQELQRIMAMEMEFSRFVACYTYVNIKGNEDIHSDCTYLAWLAS